MKCKRKVGIIDPDHRIRNIDDPFRHPGGGNHHFIEIIGNRVSHLRNSINRRSFLTGDIKKPGEHGKPLARELWLSYLHFYGGQIQPANPDPNEGWVQLPDGSWWVAQAQVVEWADMNDLSEIK